MPGECWEPSDPQRYPAGSASAEAHSPTTLQQREGRVSFTVGDAFYRPRSALARDLAVLVATLDKDRLGHLRVLDAMTGSGVRPLRYLVEAGADWVWANEGNPDHADLLATNLAQVEATHYRITHEDAQAVFFRCYQERDFYDLVDIDNFGSLGHKNWRIALSHQHRCPFHQRPRPRTQPENLRCLRPLPPRRP